MSEGLAELRLLSSGNMSAERPLIVWSSRLPEISEAHFQIGTVFINHRFEFQTTIFSPEETTFHDTITVFLFFFFYM